jgi:acetoin:2,6-dichlorophenolindophenol oxidoreductase subunit beta
MSGTRYNYGTAMLSAFEYLLANYPEVFVIGQGTLEPMVCGQFNDRSG